jgi:hypothetical protein
MDLGYVNSQREFPGLRSLREIGRGAVGVVYLAEDAANRRVAIKHITAAGPGGSVHRRELAALKILGERLDGHEALIAVRHVAADDEGLHYVMELADLEGDPPVPRTLAREIEAQGRLGTAVVLEIAERLARALGAIHDAGVVHRDVKPANILSVGGVWKLGDIGLLAEERTEMTAVGTPDFIPPWGPIDRRADLYALGRVIYCMVTGLPARSFPTLPADLLTPESQRSTKLLNRLITRACDPDPDKRFQAAGEFIDAIERTRAETNGAGTLLSRRSVLAAAGGAFGASVLGGVIWTARGASNAAPRPVPWEPVFDGVSLDGWKVVNDDGVERWLIEDGAIVAREDAAFKSLDLIQPVGFGRFRATVTPTRDRGRLGLSYGQPGASFFLFYEDKYVWIRGGKHPDAPESPGRWRSFPGPVNPAAGESITMEVDWRPDRCRLLVNDELLQEVDGHPDGGGIGLHVWGGDGGRFQDLVFQSLPQARDGRIGGIRTRQ